MGNRGQKRTETTEELPADKRACSSLEFRPSTSNSAIQTTSSPHETHDADMDTSSSTSGSTRSDGEGERDSAYGSCDSENSYRDYYRRRSSGDQSKFSKILSSLTEDRGESGQLAALTELCEMLSFCTDSSLSGLMADSFSPILVKLARHESNPDIMLLAIRAITYFCDVHPRSSSYLVRHDAVPALCQRLMAIEYLDVAEQCLQALEKISREQPLACLQAGAIMAVLKYIDFFSTSVQRVALSTVVNICKKLPSECPTPFMDTVPILCNLLQYEDRQLVESVTTCLIRIGERVCLNSDMLDELCKHGLIQQVAHLLDMNGRTSMPQPVHLGLIGLLVKLASGSILAVKTLFEINVSSILKDILASYDLSHGIPSNPMVDGKCNQVHEVLKLLNVLNENAKLKVKQKEDEKLWKGLESKFSSTKTYCDQLAETLHLLAGQVQDAEKDKQDFEDKLSASSVALDNLQGHLKSLSSRLESSEETVRNREKELGELLSEKEELVNAFNYAQNRAASLLEEKDVMVKNFEETIAANGVAIENLNSELEKLHLDLSQKEDALQDLRGLKEKLDKEKDDVLIINKEFADKLDKTMKEIQNHEELVHLLSLKFIELESHSLTISEKVVQLNASFETCLNLAQEEKHLASQLAQQKFDKLVDRSMGILSERNALELVNQELNVKIIELQKEQEFAMVQHAEECRLAEQTIRRLESEAETVVSKKNEKEMLITQLKEKIDTLLEDSTLSEKKVQDLLLKLSELEISNKDHSEKLEANLNQKQDKIDVLKKEIEKHEEHVHLLEKQVSQLTDTLEENGRLVVELKDQEKQLEDQKEKIQASLTDAETKLTEAKKQYDQMLESKQLELSRHLKEISQRNDQAINEIRRKYELEKLESINLEKEKTDKVIGEMERKFEQKLEESKEESRQYLLRVQEEHAASISHIQQEHDQRVLNLISDHAEELKCAQLQAENDLREKTMLLQNEHEDQLKALRREHVDELRRLQEELDIQKSKEERQRALLQLQWKVMGDNPQDDQEVNSKKGSPYLRTTETPVSNLLRKVEKGNTGSAMSLSKHSRKVTHREYEVETSNGGTITKRRKTKSTVMFGDPRKRNKGETPVAITPRHIIKEKKRQGQQKPSNIGDLFSEGSLNPYADDPYAFD